MVVEMRGAALVLIFVGCNRPATNIASDAAPDSAIDATGRMDAPPSGTIRVTVYDENNPGKLASGIRVDFVAPDLTSQTVMTDGSGVAAARAYENTTVTVVQRLASPGAVALSTYYGLNPGDSVVAGPPIPPSHFAGSAIVELPILDGGKFYDLAVSCPVQEHALGSNPVTIEVDYFEPCTTEVAATLVGTVSDENYQLLGASIQNDVDLAAGGTITMPAYQTEPTATTAEFSNMPAEPDPWSFRIDYFLGGDYSSLLSETYSGSSAAGTVDVTAPGYPTGNHATLVLDIPHGTHLGWSEFRVYEPAATTFSVDASGMIRAIATVDTGSDEIEWTESGDGAAPTLVVAALTWGGSRALLMTPYTGASLSFKQIPSDVAPVMPSIVGMESVSAGGSTYEELLSALTETVYADGLNIAVSPLIDYWRSQYPPL